MEVVEFKTISLNTLSSAQIDDLVGDNDRFEEEFSDLVTDESRGLLERVVLLDDDMSRKLGAVSLELVADIEDAFAVEQNIPPIEQYRAQDAEHIVMALLHGDTSFLAYLPQDFQEALEIRMNQRIQELDDGTITESYFKEEVMKMCMVAGNRLWVADYPINWALTHS